jgi:trimethylamine--corrinoid protein Co-methyltransferase
MREAMSLNIKQLNTIHTKTVELLEGIGIDFHLPAASEWLKRKGFKVNGTKVHITERQLMDAIDATPDHFVLKAPTSDKQVPIGKDDFVLTSTSGATSVITAQGERRNATLSDYLDFLKLNHTSDVLKVVSPLIVQPCDLPSDTGHIDIMIKALTMSDKPCMATAHNPVVTRDSLTLLAHCTGSFQKFESDYHSIFSFNALSPLGFAADQVEAMMMVAKAKQPLTITNMAMGGTTAPIKTEHAIVMGNAEILAGIVFIQSITPGLPVIYGSTSCMTDLVGMISALGAPETLQLQRSVIALASHYNLICRTGGSLTDSHLPDGRGMAESALVLENAICHGAHFIMHACGMISSYLGASFEKWLLDEENCRILSATLKPLDFESVDIEANITSGISGGFLNHPDTFRHCRAAYRSPWKRLRPHDTWYRAGAEDSIVHASQAVKERLASYQRPEFGATLEKELNNLMV